MAKPRDRPASARERMLAAARAELARGTRPAVARIVAEAGVSKATFYRVFGSRGELFQELAADPEPDHRGAVLEAAGELLARDGLARLSMDEVAQRAGVSRARLYRLFPGKSALFAAMVRAFSPLEVVVATMERLGGEPPEVAMPELAAAVLRTASEHFGLLRPLIFEVSSLGPDVREAVVGEFAPRMLGALGGYLSRQMEEGRLRPMHPILAFQSFAGPVMLHVLMGRAIADGLGIPFDSEAAVREFATIWVRGMRPDGYVE